MTKSNNNPIQRGYNPNSCWPILIVFSLLPYFINFKNAMPARATKAAPTIVNNQTYYTNHLLQESVLSNT